MAPNKENKFKFVMGAELQPSVLQERHSTFSQPEGGKHSLSMLPLLGVMIHLRVTFT